MTFKRHEFMVTRQRQWPDGTLCVEINQGGLDYCNPGALVGKYPGEFEVFEGMTPAVEAGIRVYKSWKADCPDEEIGIAVGNTGGDTLPFDGEELTPEHEESMLVAARKFDEKLPRCAQCGELLTGERYGDPGLGEYDCCSEYCAEKYYFTPLEADDTCLVGDDNDEQDED
jgi:hypothetical protein